MEQYKLLIDGMSCAACSAAVEKALKRVDGVEKAEVNLATGTAIVTADNIKADTEKLQVAIKKAGFSCRIPNTDENLQPEQDENKASPLKRVLLLLPFALPLFYLAHVSKLPLPFADYLGSAQFAVYNATLQLLLLIPLLAQARHIYKKGISSILHRAPGMDALVSLGTITATAYSIYLYIRLLLENGSAGHLYFGSAGMILFFVMLGKALEENSRRKSAKALRSLLSLRPQTAHLVRADEILDVSASVLQAEDVILVKPGEKYPADGVVISGTGDADEALLTGESVPVEKMPDSPVFCGAINLNGALHIKVTKSAAQTLLAGIIRTVEQAQASKAPIAKLADKISAIFAPTVFVIALLSGLGWWLGTRDITKALTTFISVLVVACPCALGLATPTAIISATGRGAKDGILIRNGEALQKLAGIDTVVFDKTGTLTSGKLSVRFVKPHNIDEKDLLMLAAAAESVSEHPAAKAVYSFAQQNGITPVVPEDFIAVPGRGVRASVDDKTVLAGNQRFMQENGVTVPTITDSDGATLIWIASDGAYKGCIGAADTVRPEAADGLKALAGMNIKTALVTGDNAAAAKQVGDTLQIDRVFAGILPDGKREVIADLRKQGKKTVFVGDGINDAPALASADVGIAMGTGTDVAMDTADAVLLRSDIRGVAQTLLLAKKTIRIVKQNLVWAFGYNVLMLPSAAGILTLLGLPMPDPGLAAVAMSLSSVAVVTNSLRLLKKTNINVKEK
ncbi:MAG: cadmium-translocating P-type ATPase [Ruminococcaceae bacterium]|nr:cadmium-translocating P-type ATPase [Oscillospiraceae bacterium]